MPFRNPFVLPALFVLIATAYAVTGRLFLSGAYAVIALGVALHGVGVRRAVRPFQWFGAGIAAFAFLLVLWRAFLR